MDGKMARKNCLEARRQKCDYFQNSPFSVNIASRQKGPEKGTGALNLLFLWAFTTLSGLKRSK